MPQPGLPHLSKIAHFSAAASRLVRLAVYWRSFSHDQFPPAS